MPSRFFDAHTHPHFSDNPDAVRATIDRARAAGVWMMLVGTDVLTSQRALTWSAQYADGVYGAVGLHPTHTVPLAAIDPHERADMERSGAVLDVAGSPFDSDAFRELAMQSQTVAIGECGLDYFRLTPESRHTQQEVLLQHVALAREVDKPLMIHCRAAFDDLIPLLRDHRAELPSRSGVIHFFTGSVDELDALLDLGFAVTFGGVVTFVRQYDEAVRRCPVDRLLSETDAPYVAPVPYRGRTNEPAYVVQVVEYLARLRGVGVEELRDQIFATAQQLFRIPAPID